MKVLHLRTGCRLHFGLIELAAGEPMRFAGLGLMLDQPNFELAFSAAESFTIDASHIEPPSPAAADASANSTADSKAEFESRIGAAIRQRQTLVAGTAQSSTACHVRLLNALPLHSGLGAGTQLAASVAAGLELFTRARPIGPAQPAARSLQPARWQPILDAWPTLSAQWLSQHAARGLRSAVGLVGFLRGGLILDEGYPTDKACGANADPMTRPLAAQTLQLAAAWRVVLAVPQQRAEISGAKEAEVMAELGSLPNPHRQQMLALAQRAMGLAADNNQFAEFTDCLDRYMQYGAQLFSRYQGGMYNGADVTEAVQLAQAVGLRGVGQSSWGPTVFGFAESQACAEHRAKQLRRQRPNWSVRISTPATSGARYRWQPSLHKETQSCDSSVQ